MGAAGLIELFADRLLGQRKRLRVLWDGAVDDGAVARLVDDSQSGGLVDPRRDVKVDADTPRLGVPVFLPRLVEELCRVPVLGLLAADAVHILLFPGKIAVGESVAGKGQLQHIEVLFRGSHAVVNRAVIDFCDDGAVLRPLHPPLDLDAFDAHIVQLRQVGDQAVVLEGEGVVVHVPPHAVLHPARLGAEPAVAAAPPDQGGHIALAAVAEAQRPVDEHLQLDGGALRDEADLLFIQLPRQYHALHPQLRRGEDAGEIVDAHLGAGVEREIGAGRAQHPRRAQVLHQHRVGAGLAEEAPGVRQLLQFPVRGERVERDIDLAAALTAVFDGLEVLLAAKIFRVAPGVERAVKAEVDGIRAVLHGGDDRLRTSGGGKKLQHICFSVCTRAAGAV